jgi:hypothetical protein
VPTRSRPAFRLPRDGVRDESQGARGRDGGLKRAPPVEGEDPGEALKGRA